jgi:hypothetical protein
MRDRHVPRLCPSCRAPMARQEDLCWKCGADWLPEGRPPRIPVRASGASEHMTAARTAARVDLERWWDEGGSVNSESASGTTARRDRGPRGGAGRGGCRRKDSDVRSVMSGRADLDLLGGNRCR